jgi:hypothetical protein
MPWNQTDVMTEKERFVMLAQTGRFTITDLCTDFGMDPKGLGRAAGYPTALLQTRASTINAHGSSSYGFARGSQTGSCR